MPTLSHVIKHLRESEAGKHQPWSVLTRFSTWQLWRRGLRRPMSFSTVTGTRLTLLPGASDSLSSYWYLQIPDFEELCFAFHLLRRDDLFVDVGANQGGWSLTIAGRGSRVIAFEPVPLTRERLLANVGQNSAAVSDRIQIFSFGLGNRAGQVSFTADLDAGNHQVSDPSGENTIRVELAKADDVLKNEHPTLIKIDVEGEELGVLQGARDILARQSLLAVVVETFRPSNHARPALIAAEAILRDHGLLPMAYDPWRRELTPLQRPEEGGQNTIYARPGAALRDRLKEAEPIRALGRDI